MRIDLFNSLFFTENLRKTLPSPSERLYVSERVHSVEVFYCVSYGVSEASMEYSYRRNTLSSDFIRIIELINI